MPLVILVIDFLLDTTIINNDSAEVLFVIRSVKSLSSLPDLVEKLSPLFNIILEQVINLLTLKIPERLVLLAYARHLCDVPRYVGARGKSQNYPCHRWEW